MDQRKTDPEEIKERARFAKALLEDKAFQYAVLEIRKRWFAQFLESNTETDAIVWRAKLQTLEAIATELAMQINDYKALLKRQS